MSDAPTSVQATATDIRGELVQAREDLQTALRVATAVSQEVRLGSKTSGAVPKECPTPPGSTIREIAGEVGSLSSCVRSELCHVAAALGVDT